MVNFYIDLILYRVTHGLDFRADCTEFILSVSLHWKSTIAHLWIYFYIYIDINYVSLHAIAFIKFPSMQLHACFPLSSEWNLFYAPLPIYGMSCMPLLPVKTSCMLAPPPPPAVCNFMHAPLLCVHPPPPPRPQFATCQNKHLKFPNLAAWQFWQRSFNLYIVLVYLHASNTKTYAQTNTRTDTHMVIQTQNILSRGFLSLLIFYFQTETNSKWSFYIKT